MERVKVRIGERQFTASMDDQPALYVNHAIASDDSAHIYLGLYCFQPFFEAEASPNAGDRAEFEIDIRNFRPSAKLAMTEETARAILEVLSTQLEKRNKVRMEKG